MNGIPGELSWHLRQKTNGVREWPGSSLPSGAEFMNIDSRTTHVSPFPAKLTDSAVLRVGAMVLLFAAGAVFETRSLSSLTSLTNEDIWWHLRLGSWILRNYALPHTALFSQAQGRPWADTNWGYDLLAAVGFRLFGLRAIPALLMVFRWALAVLAFCLAGGLRSRFAPAAILSIVGQYVLRPIPPGPAFCSILFFGLELFLLFESRKTGSLRPLLWLSLVFLIWANVDHHFVFGIALLFLFLVTALFQSSCSTVPGSPLSWTSSPRRNAAVVAIACAFATLLNPYFARPYSLYFQTISTAASPYLTDLHAMSFRRPEDYFLMLLTMAAFLALGLRRSRDLFQIALMIGCAILAFHTQRFSWTAVLAATCVIGEALSSSTGVQQGEQKHRTQRLRQTRIAVGLALAIVIAAVFVAIPASQQLLMAKVAQTYPVAACNYIRNHQLPPPLFNTYEWGGFLIWFLRDYPVSIDSRPGWYNDESVVQYFKVMNAEVPYSSLPEINEAGTLLLPRHSVMGEALSTLPAFRVVYSDDVAIVLTRS